MIDAGMEPPPGAPEKTLIGSVIAGAYRITGLLGTGAMGSVYRAEEVERGTPVAIKVLKKHLGASKEAGARFQREAFVGVRLLHPNCVAVSDFGPTDDGSFYLAMELLDGRPLADVIDRGGPMPWRRALHIARHVLAGLDHAHRESIVHRDIKPDNVLLVERDGDPDFAKILDFGIAKLIGDVAGQALTAAGITVGTPNYLSPEQASGGALDGRSDLYSLSIVLYEMLTGKTPFGDREPFKTLIAHTREPVPAMAALAPGVEVPPAVEALVRDGLAKRPDDRISSAASYIARIDALLAPAAVAPPAPAPRRRAWIAVIVLVLIGIAAAAARWAG
jgi:serine/threonine-protein kinase